MKSDDHRPIFVTYWWAKSKHTTNPNTQYNHTEKKKTSRLLTYQETTDQLRKDVESFGLDFYSTRITNGNYQSNINYKAQFIRKCLMKYKRPVVYMDNDLRMYKYPSKFVNVVNNNVDFMALNWNGTNRNHIFETAGPLFYFGYTPNAFRLLNEWIEISTLPIHQGKADDRLLAMVFVISNASAWCRYKWFQTNYLYFPAYFNDVPKHKVIIGHPYDSTDESDAFHLGASKNRIPQRYHQIVHNNWFTKSKKINKQTHR